MTDAELTERRIRRTARRLATARRNRAAGWRTRPGSKNELVPARKEERHNQTPEIAANFLEGDQLYG